jgi:hypothetical protein
VPIRGCVESSIHVEGRGVTRRGLLVAAGAAGLVAAGALTLPAWAENTDPDGLRNRILAGRPAYCGLVESSGQLGLPEIPRLESVIGLLTGRTRIRAFVAASDRWRVDELTPVGERDTYRLGATEYVWDFGSDQLTRIVGATSLQLPRPADLLPPTLARRLLALAGRDPVTPLPARRVAGRSAIGLRLTPDDPETTLGRLDLWADPATALPLRVELSPRAGPVLLTSAFTDLQYRTPDPADLVPSAPPGAGSVTAAADDVSRALRVLGAPPAPDRLAGRVRDDSIGIGLPGVGRYGAGLAVFALIPVGRDVAEQAIDGAAAAGGTAVGVPFGRAALATTPLITVGVHARRRGGSLLIGTVGPPVIEQALRQLRGRRPA